MQKIMTMKEVENAINPKKEDLFTKQDLVMIEVAMKFIQRHFYNKDEDKGTDTYESLIRIKDICRDALEK